MVKALLETFSSPSAVRSLATGRDLTMTLRIMPGRAICVDCALIQSSAAFALNERSLDSSGDCSQTETKSIHETNLSAMSKCT
jgi:hypothetical protein